MNSYASRNSTLWRLMLTMADRERDVTVLGREEKGSRTEEKKPEKFPLATFHGCGIE